MPSPRSEQRLVDKIISIRAFAERVSKNFFSGDRYFGVPAGGDEFEIGFDEQGGFEFRDIDGTSFYVDHNNNFLGTRLCFRDLHLVEARLRAAVERLELQAAAGRDDETSDHFGSALPGVSELVDEQMCALDSEDSEQIEGVLRAIVACVRHEKEPDGQRKLFAVVVSRLYPLIFSSEWYKRFSEYDTLFNLTLDLAYEVGEAAVSPLLREFVDGTSLREVLVARFLAEYLMETPRSERAPSQFEVELAVTAERLNRPDLDPELLSWMSDMRESLRRE